MVGVIYTKEGVSATYYYDKNHRGDVIALLDSTGTAVVKYKYDAWGNCNRYASSNVDLAHVNTIRYRSYYCDEDIGLYFPNARYYNPAWRRFISPDDSAYLDPETPNGLNLYAYCNNDPVNYVDPSVHLAAWVMALIGMGLGIGLGVAITDFIDRLDDNRANGSIGSNTFSHNTEALGAFGFVSGYLYGPQILASISSMLGSSGTGTALALAGGGSVAVAASGVIIVGGAIAIGLGLLAFTIGKSGGYVVKKYPNDHDPSHVHVFGDDILDKAHGIRIGLDGKPLPGQGKLPPGAKKAIKKLWKIIYKALSQ
ncbi:MAG: RHS repeat-associated core domain-containing protein [Clostridia bacterium]|nr:RHS repeat-associated core domain-containing protein [Clostridia bacterium]